jgi:hypothetical protein
MAPGLAGGFPGDEGFTGAKRRETGGFASGSAPAFAGG